MLLSSVVSYMSFKRCGRRAGKRRYNEKEGLLGMTRGSGKAD